MLNITKEGFMLKKWVKRIFIIVLVLITLFYALFEIVEVDLDAWKTAKTEYTDEYLLEFSRYYYSGWIKMSGCKEVDYWLIMFRGRRNKFIDKVLGDI